jgi:lactoylglutathione lyase
MLNLLVIRSLDLKSAEIFYQALGLKFVKHQHGKGLPHLAAEKDGFVFEIYPQQDKPTHHTRLGFCVDSVARTIEVLTALGGKVLSSPRLTEWGYRAVIKDPDGHTIELIQSDNSAI